MKTKLNLLVAILLFLAAIAERAWGFEMTPVVQAELEKMKTQISGWAGDSVIVKAVTEQNGKGPIAGMDNAKWKTIRRSDDAVKEFQNNAAGKYLKSKFDASGGTFTEAFLNAAQGEKVAFVEKTTRKLSDARVP